MNMVKKTGKGANKHGNHRNVQPGDNNGGGHGDVASCTHRLSPQNTTQSKKRQRHSTGGTYEAIDTCKSIRISKEEFKKLPSDDKLVKMFEIIQ